VLKRSVIYRASQYEVILVREDDGGFSVSAPNFPGAYSDGDTEEAAMENIVDAIAMLEASREDVAVILRTHGIEAEGQGGKLTPSPDPETEQV
jgi:predicted RNase H-like HicB family nuclease